MEMTSITTNGDLDTSQHTIVAYFANPATQEPHGTNTNTMTYASKPMDYKVV